MEEQRKEDVRMRVVRLQERRHDTILTVPAVMRDQVADAEYFKCTVDEKGIHYAPVML
jgi:hypothetical protein